MSGVFKAVATIAGIVAIIPSPIQPIAAAVAAVATIGAQVTQKKPRAQGSANSITIGSNMLMPYAMGRTYTGGAMIHDVGYGGTVNDVPNPYSSSVFAWSQGGPHEEIEAFQADFATVTFSDGAAQGYYSGFMWLDTQLGALPESTALSGPHGAIPGWGASHKLSGYAAGLVTLKFDKKGKIFASGVPQFGAILKGARAYDPRLDSTYPGGSGAQRWDDESTWTWTENAALHALTYARGRYQNGKKVFGCGFRQDGVEIATFVELANICDANGWKVGGVIYEPGSRWDNLKRILEVAAAEPAFVGGRLTVKYSAPKVALDTITADDLAPGEYRVPAMKTWRARKNGLIPKFRSEAHKWEYVQSDLVSDGSYVTEDGEDRQEEYQLDLCQQKDQAAQVAAYKLVNAREFGPIVLPCKPRLFEYVPGEALNVDIPELGLNDQLCVIVGRNPDPATATVELTLESETSAKHSFALGQTGTAPPTPSITSGEEADAVVDIGLQTRGDYDEAEIYYQGNIVQDQGAAWEYIHAEPSSGNAPPALPDTENDHWRLLIEGGVDGAPGHIIKHVWKRASSAPATPTGNGTPSGWSASPPAGSDPLWLSVAEQEADGTLVGSWSAPIRHDGPAGAPGATGAAGASSALVYIFQRAASAPTLPSASTTYTFATGVLTGLNNGWSQVPPAGSNPLYVSVATATGNGSTDTIASGEWSGANILVENGAPGAAGLSAAPVLLFQRTGSATPPALPSATTTYTFATSVLTGINNGWSQTMPTSGGAFRWMTSATAAAVGATDTIGSGEWAVASLIAQDGATGAAGLNNATVYLYQRAPSSPSLPGSTLTYTFATGALSGTLGSWSQQVPAGDDPLWVTAALAIANTATDTIASGEWATPVIQAQDGSAGLSSAPVILYQRNTTGAAPAVPGATLTYTFATGALSGTLGSWSQTIPDEALGGFLFVTQAVAIGNGATDTIASGEWATVRLIAQDKFELSGNELFDAMLYADAAQLARGWETKTGSGEISQVTDADASGAVAMEVGNNSGNDSLALVHRNMLPYDATALWMISYEAEAVAGSPNLYAGVAGRAADRTTLVNTSGSNTWDQQHLMAASGAPLPAAYQSYVGFFTGRSGSGFSFPNSDPLNPSKMHTNVAFVSPQMLLNYPSSTAKTGVREVRLKRLDRVPTWRNGGVASLLRGDSWAKQDGSTDWAGVWFTPIGSSKGCSVSAIVPTSGTEWEIGLTTESTPAAGTQTPWAARGNGDGQIDIYENGSLAQNNVTTVAAGDRIEVSYDQANVKVRKNGAVVGDPAPASLSGEVKGKVRLGAGSTLTNMAFERGGAGGTDGESGYTITPPQIVYIAVTANYVPKDAELPQSITFSVRQGATDLSDDSSVDYSWSDPSGVTASMGGTNGKVLTVTGMTSNAAVTGQVTITRDSVTIAVVDITFKKVRDGQGSSPLVDDTLSVNNSSSYSGTQGTLIRTCGPGTISVDLHHPYEASGASAKLAGRLSYRQTPGSGTFTVLGSEEVDPAPSGALPGEPSSLSFQRTVPGPTTPANWEFLYENRKISGSGTLANMTGETPKLTVSGDGT